MSELKERLKENLSQYTMRFTPTCYDYRADATQVAGLENTFCRLFEYEIEDILNIIGCTVADYVDSEDNEYVDDIDDLLEVGFFRGCEPEYQPKHCNTCNCAVLGGEEAMPYVNHDGQDY